VAVVVLVVLHVVVQLWELVHLVREITLAYQQTTQVVAVVVLDQQELLNLLALFLLVAWVATELTGKAEEQFMLLAAVVAVVSTMAVVTLVVLADLVMPITIGVVIQAAMHKHLQPTLVQVVAVEEYIVHLAPMVHQVL
jgi:hypothetical protein